MHSSCGVQVAIVGIGGVGSVAAEMLTRCGVGRLLMYGALHPAGYNLCMHRCYKKNKNIFSVPHCEAGICQAFFLKIRSDSVLFDSASR